MKKTFSVSKSGAILMTTVCVLGVLLCGCKLVQNPGNASGSGNNMPDISSSISDPGPSTSTDNSNAGLDTTSEPTLSSTPVITDIVLSDAEIHEVIVPQEFTAGEHVENPYYKRTSDADGTPVFAVVQVSNGQVAYLPFDVTAVYHTAEGPCYYEKKVLTYKLDGVETTTDQYELWVVGSIREDVTADPETSMDADAMSVSEQIPDDDGQVVIIPEAGT